MKKLSISALATVLGLFAASSESQEDLIQLDALTGSNEIVFDDLKDAAGESTACANSTNSSVCASTKNVRIAHTNGLDWTLPFVENL